MDNRLRAGEVDGRINNDGGKILGRKQTEGDDGRWLDDDRPDTPTCLP